MNIQLPDGARLLMLCKFGSHLYGTDTPDSDTDYKGIYMPSPKQILLGKYPKSISMPTRGKEHGEKNGKEDIDCQVYSLHYFIELALQGQTVAMDMLHVSQECLLETSHIWTSLVLLKDKFYTTNLNAFVGYAQKQAAKYGIKGSRLAAAKLMDNFLQSFPDEVRMATIWNQLPTGEHIEVVEGRPDYVQVCGKKIQSTVTVGYAQSIIQSFIKHYGHRAKQAESNEGVDFKALSHALRAAYQCRAIYFNGDIKFPLPEARLLRRVKQGEYEYKVVAGWLETAIHEVQILADRSTYQNKPDRKFFESWLYYHCLNEINMTGV